MYAFTAFAGNSDSFSKAWHVHKCVHFCDMCPGCTQKPAYLRTFPTGPTLSSFPRKRESRAMGHGPAAWIPAFAGMTGNGRGNDGKWARGDGHRTASATVSLLQPPVTTTCVAPGGAAPSDISTRPYSQCQTACTPRLQDAKKEYIT